MVAAGVGQHVVDALGGEPRRVAVAVADKHAGGREILHGGGDGLEQLGQLLVEVDAGLLVKQIGEVAEVAQYGDAVARRLIPYIGVGVEAVVGQLLQAPLAHAVLVEDIVEVVLTAVAVGVGAVGLQHQANLRNELRLEEVPVVVGHAIGDDVLGPLLQGAVANLLVVALHEWAQNGIGLIELGDGVLVDDLEGGHAIKRLHVAVRDVGSDVAVIDAAEEHPHHGQGQVGIAAVARELIQTGGVAGDGENLDVERGDVAARLVRVGLLHLTRRGIDEGHVALLIVVVRYDILYLRPVVIRLGAAGTVHLHRRLRCTVATHMVVGLGVAEHVGGMGLPIHLQARVKPVGLLLHMGQIGVNFLAQLVDLTRMGEERQQCEHYNIKVTTSHRIISLAPWHAARLPGNNNRHR